MKIGDGAYRGDEVPLPVEVLSLITAHVALTQDYDAQSTLWACCLVGQAWYAASISHLYFRPHLSSQNFDQFVRTVCPPLHTRKARIGLEDMVKHLDMREIAYESSNSLTSRLLNRTKSSLQSFTSPAVTFSVASLAPLSKCFNMTLLDMSSDHYTFTLPQLLDSISDLDALIYLALPQDITTDRDQPLAGRLHWPKNLVQLTVPGQVCNKSLSWDTLFQTWPATLTTVVFSNFDIPKDTFQFSECLEKANFVERLEIGRPVRTTSGRTPGIFYDILEVFPRLKTITVPSSMMVMESLFRLRLERAARQHTCLETLTVKATVARWWSSEMKVNTLTAYIPVNDLKTLLKVPRLRRLDVHGSFVDIEAVRNDDELEHYSELFKERAPPEQLDSSGIFLFQNP